MLSGTNLTFAHLYNQRIVLETVRLRGPLSRVEISGHTALSTQTVTNIVDKLLDRGVLQTGERRSGRRGQPAVEIDLNPQGAFAVGLHLDRDHMTGLLLDLSGKIHQSTHREWDFPSPDEALPFLAETVAALAQMQGLRIPDLWGVGLALPGPLDIQAGSPIAPPNFPGWDGVPIRDLLADAVGCPVYLENDATAAAVGERWFGQGREIRDYFYVFFGIGLGGGMILDGKPYRGAFDTAAMFGHLPVSPGGERCVCGGVGCLELSVSLASLYKTLELQGRIIQHASELTVLFAHSDRGLIDWLDRAADCLTPALVAIENLLNPAAIIFGGRLPEPLLDYLLDGLSRRLPPVQMRALPRHPQLLRAQFLEDAAALGAATLPLFEAFTPGREVLSIGKAPVTD